MRKAHLIVKIFIFSISLSVCFILLSYTSKITVEKEAPLAHGKGREVDTISGSLDIRGHPQEGKLEPSVEFLVIDPRQRRAGWDSKTGNIILDIPGSSYEKESIDDIEGAPGPETLILYIAGPISGNFILEVIGRESGSYTLEIRALDCKMNPSRAYFSSVKITKGSVRRYRIKYSNTKGSKVEVQAQTDISFS